MVIVTGGVDPERVDIDHRERAVTFFGNLYFVQAMDEAATTGRAVIVDEGWRTGSLSAEIMARIMEQAFYELDAPVARVCSAEVPIPYPRHLEEAAVPQADTIATAARSLVQPRG